MVEFLYSLSLETQIFIVVISFLLLYFLITFNQKTASYGSVILTTTGIFATFLGIAIGLNNLKVENLEQSIPQLLMGIKTAFWASVAGIGGSLILKIYHHIKYHKAYKFNDKTAAVNNEKAMQAIYSELVNLRKDQNEGNNRIIQAHTNSLLKISEQSSKILIDDFAPTPN